MGTITAYEAATRIRQNLSKVIIGQDTAIDLLLTTLFSGGHVLLEDTPGTGKTLLAKSLAKSIDATFERVQFTPDLLPSDITGIHIYQPKSEQFSFVKGPAFTNILLADEINRATPRTQSALLECMEEQQITVDGETYSLQDPFFVIATENPVETIGTYPLPEAQLDRFSMKITMGYGDTKEEVAIMQRFQKENPLDTLVPVLSTEEIIQVIDEIRKVYVHPCIQQYIADVIVATRKHPAILLGASSRCTLALLRSAMAYALVIQNRSFVTPDDIKALAVPVIAHRLLSSNQLTDTKKMGRIVKEILSAIPVPTEKWDL